MTVVPITSSRISDLLVRQQLLAQLQENQRALLTLQTQVSTGRRLAVPSDDAPAASRAMSLQQLLERKDQIETNLRTSQTFLDATDAALASVSSLLNSVKAEAISVVGTASSDSQRAAAAESVQRAIQSLINVGNQQFRGRYLFAGSDPTVQPFALQGQEVAFSGNEGSLLSYADVGLLLPTNIDGHRVFGTLSNSVQGGNLAPNLTAQTRLTDLRGGRGIRPGSIELSDGSQLSVVDISSAETIGDVARLIEAHPPSGRVVTAEVTPQGLELRLQGAGNLIVREVGGGTTAAELGILDESGNNPVVGTAITPRVTLTTPLSEILGTRARAEISLSGNNNDVVLEAATRGTNYNGVSVVFAGGGTKGSETAVFASNTLTITIEDGVSDAADVVAAVNGAVGLPFTARLGPHDPDNSGIGVVTTAASGAFAGGLGIEFDQTSGLQITNGNATYAISLASATRVEDVLNLINGSGAGVLAEINAAGTGINVRSRLSGSDFFIGELGGSTATDLGLRSVTSQTSLAELNHGRGVRTTEGVDFTMERTDGVVLDIDLDGALTVQDVLDRINTASTAVGGVQVVARLAVTGNGIELVADDPAPIATLKVQRTTLGAGAIDLGLIPVGGTESVAPTQNGTVYTLSGTDTHPQEVAGVFNALVRLRDALLTNDQPEIERAIQGIDSGNTTVNFARADVGARGQTLDSLRARVEDENVQLQDALSQDIDVDLTSAISDLLSRQAAFQASLQVASRALQFTLLDFL